MPNLNEQILNKAATEATSAKPATVQGKPVAWAVSDVVMPLESMWDDGQDHHPPGWYCVTGDELHIKEVRTEPLRYVVAHKGNSGGFIVRHDEVKFCRRVAPPTTPQPATSAKPEPTTWHKTDTDGWSASHESNDNTCHNAITNGKITLLVVSRDDNGLSFDEAGEAHDKSVADVLRILNATHCATTTGTEPTEAMIEAYFQTVTAMFHDSETERIRCGLRAAIASQKGAA